MIAGRHSVLSIVTKDIHFTYSELSHINAQIIFRLSKVESRRIVTEDSKWMEDGDVDVASLLICYNTRAKIMLNIYRVIWCILLLKDALGKILCKIFNEIMSIIHLIYLLKIWIINCTTAAFLII